MAGSSNNSKEKTETITFRLKAELIDQLKKETIEEGMNLNSLVQKALMEYLWCHSGVAKGTMVPTSKSRFKAIMEELSKEQILRVSEANDKTNPKSLQFVLHGEYTEQALSESLEIWSIASRFDFVKRILDDKRVYMSVRHGMGYKCSLFFCTTIVEAIHNASGRRPLATVSEDYFALTVDPTAAKHVLQSPELQRKKIKGE
ncbi:hypothetical protein NTE_01864 [Candidatus Nitrososphaera evergladensis SR1]|uniref:Uncharacterized protein n=1 Tax=Candidatus Nitrososphaera evergladensis SR1 TaxID=1459636 RepID=A0A075MX96_9ARCH|nr:hypothetical protein [Candidatus Nitrososphaera evergladensis]AIF83924.1 hypothetical protein NTE_01864 [Candidatus Nitrososphaera evergladensis SR1]